MPTTLQGCGGPCSLGQTFEFVLIGTEGNIGFRVV